MPAPPPIPPNSQETKHSIQPIKTSRSRQIALAVNIAIVLIYSGAFRLLFDTDLFKGSGGVVSLSFVFSVPFAMGMLFVGIGRLLGSDDGIKQAIFGPLMLITFALAICLVLKIEAMVCVIMAAPILYVCSILGGLLAHWLLPRNHPKNRLYVTFAVFLPLLAAQIESLTHWPTEVIAIQNTIEVDAPAATIWEEIASVRAIPAEQVPDQWIYRIGFPKPIAAELDREGVGGIRIATFERDVSFFEVITEWSPPTKLAFKIHADPDFIPHTAFDQHIIVGGRFYDVLDGIYEIEVLPDNRARLYLTSHHRLGTRFNAYAAWWSEKIMDQIQGSILEVIRQRSETAAATKNARSS